MAVIMIQELQPRLTLSISYDRELPLIYLKWAPMKQWMNYITTMGSMKVSPQWQHRWAVIHQTLGCATVHWCGSPQTQLAQQQDPQLRWWSQTAGKVGALAGGGWMDCLAGSDTQHRAGPRQRRHSTGSPQQQTWGLCPGSPWKDGWAGSSQHPGWWEAASKGRTIWSPALGGPFLRLVRWVPPPAAPPQSKGSSLAQCQTVEESGGTLRKWIEKKMRCNGMNRNKERGIDFSGK